MITFLKNVSYFLLPFLVTSIIFCFWMIIISKNVVTNSQQFHLNQKTSILFAGDSHIVGAIADTLYPNSKNIGLRSETYYHTYFKLKYFIKKQKIDKVFLGFSYHNISSYYDNFIDGFYSLTISSKFFFILPLEEKIKVLFWNKKKIIKLLKEINNSAIFFRSNRYDLNSNFIDGFETFNYKTSFSETICEKRINEQFYVNGKVSPFSISNIFYLKQIINLCKAEGIELVLLTTPLHSKYVEKVPKLYNEAFKTEIKKNRFINLENINLLDSSFCPDGDHLNFIGASKTNEVLQLRI